MAKKKHPFIGQKIKAIRPMTNEEAEREGWDFGRHGAPNVIELADGGTIYPSRDPEGNGPGCLFGTAPDGVTIHVTGG